MVKRTGPTNVYMRQLIGELQKTGSSAWKQVAEGLSKSRRSKIEVNVGELGMHAKDNEIIVVPGIVLANGDLEKPLTVAAWRFTPAAEEKIKKAKGKTLTIDEMVKKNPKGSNMRIML